MKHHLPRLLLIGFAACLIGCHRAENPDHQRSRKAAVKAYNQLIKGNYEGFVQRIYYVDSLTDTYRAQLIDRLAEYAQAERDRRGGMVRVEAVGDTLFGDQAHVFLEVTFGDDSHHEIGVPMVKVDGQWRLQ